MPVTPTLTGPPKFLYLAQLPQPNAENPSSERVADGGDHSEENFVTLCDPNYPPLEERCHSIIREGANVNETAWDLAFLAIGALLVVGGWLLARSGERE